VQVLHHPSGQLLRHAVMTAAAAVAVVAVILAPTAAGRMIGWIRPVSAGPHGR